MAIRNTFHSAGIAVSSLPPRENQSPKFGYPVLAPYEFSSTAPFVTPPQQTSALASGRRKLLIHPSLSLPPAAFRTSLSFPCSLSLLHSARTFAARGLHTRSSPRRNVNTAWANQPDWLPFARMPVIRVYIARPSRMLRSAALCPGSISLFRRVVRGARRLSNDGALYERTSLARLFSRIEGCVCSRLPRYACVGGCRREGATVKIG